MRVLFGILTFLFFTSNVIAESDEQSAKPPIDSVQLKTLESLNHMANKYVIKIGTVYLDSKRSYQDSLFSLVGTIVVSNGDRTIDVFHGEGAAKKEDLAMVASNYVNQGFKDLKIAFLTIEDYNVKLAIDEALDDKYTVTIGSFDHAVPPPAFMKILSVKGIKAVWDASSSRYTYVYGLYYNQEKAKEATLLLANAGLEPDVLRYGKGILSGVQPSDLYTNDDLASFETNKDTVLPIDTKGLVFRVQVGTFSSVVSKGEFKGKDVLVFPFIGGVYKVFSGSFTSYRDAFKHKLDVVSDGVVGPFIVAYKDGERISVAEVVTKEEYRAIKLEFGIE